MFLPVLCILIQSFLPFSAKAAPFFKINMDGVLVFRDEASNWFTYRAANHLLPEIFWLDSNKKDELKDLRARIRSQSDWVRLDEKQEALVFKTDSGKWVSAQKWKALAPENLQKFAALYYKLNTEFTPHIIKPQEEGEFTFFTLEPVRTKKKQEQWTVVVPARKKNVPKPEPVVVTLKEDHFDIREGLRNQLIRKIRSEGFKIEDVSESLKTLKKLAELHRNSHFSVSKALGVSFWDGVIGSFLSRRWDMNLSDWSHFLQSLSKLGVRPASDTLKTIFSSKNRFQDVTRFKDAVRILGAFATLGVKKDKEIIWSLLETIDADMHAEIDHVEKNNFWTFTSLVRALAMQMYFILGSQDDFDQRLFSKMEKMAKLSFKYLVENVDQQDYSGIRTALFALKVCNEILGIQTGSADPLLKYIEQVKEHTRSNASGTQMDVAFHVRAIVLGNGKIVDTEKVKVEEWTDEIYNRVDIVVGDKTAIHVNGPSHYIVDLETRVTEQRPLDALYDWLLSGRFERAFTVKYSIWRSMESGKDKISWLKLKLYSNKPAVAESQ